MLLLLPLLLPPPLLLLWLAQRVLLKLLKLLKLLRELFGFLAKVGNIARVLLYKSVGRLERCLRLALPLLPPLPTQPGVVAVAFALLCKSVLPNMCR